MRLFGWLFAVLALAAGPLCAQDVDLRTGAAPVKIVHSLESLLDFTEKERADLDAEKDGVAGIDSPGLYVLLRRGLMAADESVLLDAAPVSLKDLTSVPAVFRGRLVQLHLDIYRVSRHIPDPEVAATWWGKRDCWRLDCLDRSSGSGVVVMLAELPAWLDARQYAKPVKASLGAFFCRMALLARSGGDGDALYPLFAARTIYGRVAPRSRAGHVILFATLALLAAWWLLMRRRGSVAAHAQRRKYAASPPTGEFDDAPVNERLVEEMKKFQADRRDAAMADEEEC